MALFQNIHSHSVYCDGSLTLEAMVLAAIEKGCESFGFSGHSFAPFDIKHCMSLDDTQRYMREINVLKERYADRIELFLGIEQEYHSDEKPGAVDFVIGAVHFIKNGDDYVCIDGGPKGQKLEAETHFGGDYYAFAASYYETVSDVARKTDADVIAHFNLIAKYNFGGCLFDESDRRYVAVALDAMDEILKRCSLFEVNTGAMYRYKKPEPSPPVLLLRELYRRGGEVIVSNDCHDAESIGFKHDEIRELLKACGFRYVKKLTKDGFVDELL